ncbi:MAG: NRDE family protein [Flavobacterium sp.]|nr:NRDE family protein [Flavobacterium sp.]
MCTVTVARHNGDIIITSNRDEQISRPAAIAPQSYRIGGKLVAFPKDPLGGGTWFAVDDQKNIIVLLNGARERHEFGKSYRKSRGLIVLEIIGSSDILQSWKNIDLNNIEPFTLILYIGNRLFESQWNGSEKSMIEISENLKIWSSSPLYSDEVMRSREIFFKGSITHQSSNQELLDFHHSSEIDTPIIIDRGFLKTLSITQVHLSESFAKMTYFDLRNPDNTLVITDL